MAASSLPPPLPGRIPGRGSSMAWPVITSTLTESGRQPWGDGRDDMVEPGCGCPVCASISPRSSAGGNSTETHPTFTFRRWNQYTGGISTQYPPKVPWTPALECSRGMFHRHVLGTQKVPSRNRLVMFPWLPEAAVECLHLSLDGDASTCPSFACEDYSGHLSFRLVMLLLRWS